MSAQTVRDSLLIGNNFRSFLFNKPTRHLHAAALVFVLHGSGGSASQMLTAASNLEKVMGKENGMVVYPNGYKRYWNECRKASPAEANQKDINEEAFFLAMIDYFARNYGVDKNKVFVVGTSGGGHMAYKLGLTIPEKVRAIVALISNLPDSSNFDCVASNKPLPVMIVNGTEDEINPYHGGEVIAGFSLGFVRSTDKTFQYWAMLAGYSGEPIKKEIHDADPHDGRVIERYTFKENGKPEVVLLKVIGGKHDYPKDIDVHVEAWEFFKRQLK